MSKPTWLSIETSTHAGSLALQSHDQVFFREWTSAGSHSEVITTRLQSLCAEAQTPLANIDQIFCGTGPGSFTGIRIGLNLAKSLGYALDIPLRAFTTFDALLAPLIGAHQGPVICLVSAFRNLVYVSEFEIGPDGSVDAIGNPAALTFEQVKAKLEQHSKVSHNLPNLDFLEGSTAEMIFTEPKAVRYIDLVRASPDNLDPPKDWKHLAPLYIRASEAEEKLKTK